MSWDDEEYEVPTHQNFDDEEDIGVAESWDIESEDEGQKAPTRKRVPMAVRAEEREKIQQEQREKAALEQAEESEALRKERLRKAELDSDLNNAASLFGQVDIHPRAKAAPAQSPPPSTANQPQKLSDLAIFKPKSKQDFDNLRKTLVPILTDLAEENGLTFPNFAIDFIRDLCKPLTSDQARKVTSTLNALTNDKQREERLGRTKKKKPIVKAASQKLDEAKDTTNYDEFDDDDDFM